MRSIPTIDARYWLALSAASIFGTNTGDFVAGYLHVGHLAGLPWLLAVFAVILLLERVSPVKTPLWFWAAIITMRTGSSSSTISTRPWPRQAAGASAGAGFAGATALRAGGSNKRNAEPVPTVLSTRSAP